MSAVQFARARALARAHGHLWAACPETEGLTDAGEIARVTAAWADATGDQGPTCGFGILSPTLDDEGIVEHTSGTGRVRWYVYECGTAHVSVRRPGCDVIELTVDAAGAWRLETRGTYHERHVDTALDAVRALVPADAVAAIERQLVESCADSPEDIETRAAAWVEVLEQRVRDWHPSCTGHLPREISETLETARRRAEWRNYVIR